MKNHTKGVMPFVFVVGLVVIEPVLTWIGMGINRRTNIEYVGFAREHFGCSWLDKAGNCVTQWSDIIGMQLGAIISTVALLMVPISLFAYFVWLLWRRKYWQAWGVVAFFALVAFLEMMVGGSANAETFMWSLSMYKWFQLTYFVPSCVLLGGLVWVIQLIVGRQTRRTGTPPARIR